MIKWLFKQYAKLRWFFSGESADARKALNELKEARAKELVQAAIARGVDLSKAKKYEPKVEGTKKIKEPTDDDYKDWSKLQ